MIATMKMAMESGNRLAELKRKLNGLAESYGGSAAQDQYSELAERRYLDILKSGMDSLQGRFRKIQVEIDSLSKGGRRDSLTLASTNALSLRRDSVITKYGSLEHEHSAVLTECIGTGQGRQRRDEEMQVKYIDWAFIRYQDAKEELVAILSKHTGQTLERIRQDTERNFYMSSEEAKKYGIIDEMFATRKSK